MIVRVSYVRASIVAIAVSGLWSSGFLKQSLAADAPTSGKTTGIVVEKTDKYVMVKAEGETEPKRYLLAPDAGGAPKAEIQAMLKTVFVSNLVALEWQGADKPTLTSLKVIFPKSRTGALIGTVTAVSSGPKEFWLDVKPSGGGFTERYLPQFVGGKDGFDKKMLGAIGELNAGDKIKLAWSYDERKRAAQIQVVAKAKPTGSESKTKSDQKP